MPAIAKLQRNSTELKRRDADYTELKARLEKLERLLGEREHATK